MRLIGSADVLLPERPQKLFTIVGQHEDLMRSLVNDPYAALRVVRADADPVRPSPVRALEEVIPLVPDLDEISVAIEDVDTVLPSAAAAQAHVPVNRAHPAVELCGHRIGEASLTSLKRYDAVRGLDVDARVATEGEALGGERLRPALDDVVGYGAGRSDILRRDGSGQEADRYGERERGEASR